MPRSNRALRDMIALVCEHSNLSRQDAYTLCSLAADLHVTQMVDLNKGIHCALLESAPAPPLMSRGWRTVVSLLERGGLAAQLDRHDALTN